MAIILRNAILLHLDPLGVERGDIRIDGGAISSVGKATSSPSDEIIDCEECVVMPGLVNGHTHLYSALAVGMPPPPRIPANFHEILELIWWRLDRALDESSIEVSGTIGALDALHCGTTTLIDHHASPSNINGSLDALERGIEAVGLRAVLCYEVTDRNGMPGAAAGLEENRRYLEKCAGRKDRRFAAMVGAHAAFTMSDDWLNAVADLAKRFSAGVHIHVAEDPCDDRICREKYGASLLDRLEKFGVLQSETILGHCTHLSPEVARRISSAVAGVAHNPRSNMNNQVGYAPIGSLTNVQLGTDGIGGDMFTEAKHAWFKARDVKCGTGVSPVVPCGTGVSPVFPSHASVAPADIVAMLAQSARVAGRRLGCTLGKLAPAAAADIVITDYRPATALDATNAAGHFIFGLGPQHVRHVMIDGNWALRDRRAMRTDEAKMRDTATRAAKSLWTRMDSL